MSAGSDPHYVLLVDDIPDNLVALEALVRRPGVELLKANSAREALELLLVHEVSLALVDVIERQPLTGEITVGVSYYEAEGCNSQETGGSVTFEIPTPELGVCCPIGEAECASTGPRGGWARNI